MLDKLLQVINALRGVVVHEAEVHLVARQLPAIVQHEKDLVAHQLLVDSRQTLFEAPGQADLGPHAEEHGAHVHEQPRDPQGEQGDAGEAGEEQREENAKGEKDPGAQDPFVADVVHGEPVVVDQRLHG